MRHLLTLVLAWMALWLMERHADAQIRPFQVGRVHRVPRLTGLLLGAMVLVFVYAGWLNTSTLADRITVWLFRAFALVLFALAANLVSMRVIVSEISIIKTSLFRRQCVRLSEIQSVKCNDWSHAVVIRDCGGGKLTIPFLVEGARAIYAQLFQEQR